MRKTVLHNVTKQKILGTLKFCDTPQKNVTNLF